MSSRFLNWVILLTTVHLITSLAAALRKATANLRLPVEYHNEAQRTSEETYREIQIFEQDIPKDLFESTTYFPCIILELVEVTDSLKDGSLATVGISVGVYAKEADAYKDAFNLLEVVRREMLSNRVIADSFRLVDTITWRTAQQQPSPFFFLYGEANYSMYLTQEPFAGFYNDSGVGG